MSEMQEKVPQKTWCPHCEIKLYVLLDGDEYCRHCGSKLADYNVARCDCGRKLDRNDKFCPKCGRKVEEPQ